MFRCRPVAPVLSADGTWPQASSSCGSGAERNQMTRIKQQNKQHADDLVIFRAPPVVQVFFLSVVLEERL